MQVHKKAQIRFGAGRFCPLPPPPPPPPPPRRFCPPGQNLLVDSVPYRRNPLADIVPPPPPPSPPRSDDAPPSQMLIYCPPPHPFKWRVMRSKQLLSFSRQYYGRQRLRRVFSFQLWYQKDQKRTLRRECAGVRTIYVVDIAVPQKEKETRNMELFLLPRGIEEMERILHSCQSS